MNVKKGNKKRKEKKEIHESIPIRGISSTLYLLDMRTSKSSSCRDGKFAHMIRNLSVFCPMGRMSELCTDKPGMVRIRDYGRSGASGASPGRGKRAGLSVIGGWGKRGLRVERPGESWHLTGLPGPELATGVR